MLNINSIAHGFDFAFQGIFGIWQGPSLVHEARTVAQENVPVNTIELNSTHDDNETILERTRYVRQMRSSPKSRSPGAASSSHYAQAISTLLSRLDNDKIEWRPVVDTAKLPARKLANALCCWNVGNEQISL